MIYTCRLGGGGDADFVKVMRLCGLIHAGIAAAAAVIVTIESGIMTTFMMAVAIIVIALIIMTTTTIIITIVIIIIIIIIIIVINVTIISKPGMETQTSTRIRSHSRIQLRTPTAKILLCIRSGVRHGVRVCVGQQRVLQHRICTSSLNHAHPMLQSPASNMHAHNQTQTSNHPRPMCGEPPGICRISHSM